MSDVRKYIVTLKNYEDLDDFYDDMETEGGDLYIPDRRVECCNRREISRNTHYMLTDSEAQTVAQDSRVQSVELEPEELGVEVVPMGFTQSSSNWDKGFFLSNSMLNWGLLRCWEGSQRSNWGSDSTFSQTGTIVVNALGRNVDVVIVDGHFDPGHPDYGGRVIQRNWFESIGGTYVYPPYVDVSNSNRTSDNNHGAHVAGTVVGETQGWARGANIYNINPYGSNINGSIGSTLFDRVREFHNNKPVNPETGRKNPTIVNNSWGQIVRFALADVSAVNWRGNSVSGPFTASTLVNTYGIDVDTVNNVVNMPFRSSGLGADIQDAINDGIIVVGAAGNNGMLIDVSGGVDYNNTITGIPLGNVNTFTLFYHRGSSPASDANAICVGAVGTTATERKATFSNTGPRVDIFAPGQTIMSTVNSGGVSDSRNSSFFLTKLSGTSMASPQVCGILALVLETYPGLTHQQAIDFVIFISKLNQLSDTGGGYGDFTDLQGAQNLYLAFRQERPSDGSVFPKNNFFLRSSGQVYPRTRIRR